jgi:transcriptional regulator with XRE-family HTH domain
MTARPTAERGAFGAEMRRRSGVYLREARIRAGLTQIEIARLVGFPYYTMVSQLEQGRGFVPPERYAAYADALGIDRQEFVKEQLRVQNPWAHAILFGTKRELARLEDMVRRPQPQG